MSQFRPWSEVAPLHHGITLIEASAGTGKTYNITSLVVRLVAEAGVQIDRILVVTYTRAATAELGDRIRSRLVAAFNALAHTDPPADAVLAHLWSPDEALRSTRLRRLRRALESFDQAVISTIHGFCQRMLQQNAFESGVAFDVELTPNTEALVEEIVVDDLTNALYDADPARVAFLQGYCGFSHDGVADIVRVALGDPDAAVVPAADSVDPAMWGPFVRALALDWTTLATDFVGTVAHAVAEAKADRPSVFKKGQRKHNVDAARSWVDGVAAWLASEPPLGSTPLFADQFSAERTTDQLADPDMPLVHPCLTRLDALCAFAGLVAGATRAGFVDRIRVAFDARKERARIHTYQDLLRGLADRLGEDADPVRREALAGAIGSMFDAALIDEFQDTDHLQWTLFQVVFGRGAHYLYLIGDPKQAIYGFRGANVHVYSEATRHAGDNRYTMSVNYRSDPRLIEALNHLLDRPAVFGKSVSFEYVRVDAPSHLVEDRLRPTSGWQEGQSAAFAVHWFDGSMVGIQDPEKPLTKGALAGVLEARVAEDIVALLQSGITLRAGDAWRPVQPSDVAVLVRKGRQAVELQKALRRVGVPALLAGAASVLASDEARDVQHWLMALSDRVGAAASRVAASSALFGWTAEDLLLVESEQAAAVERWDHWLARLSAWGLTLQRRGFMAAFRLALDEEGVLVRLLTLDDGERRVTNLLHVAELVHASQTRERMNQSALLAWLTARRNADDLDSDEVELRLDRDSQAVRLLTIHKAKGLEFPICFVPYLWDGGMTQPKPNEVIMVPDPKRRTRRLLDVGTPTEASHRDIAQRENKEEALRLAYVALTRAIHRCVLYAGWVKDYEHSPLAALFHGSGADRVRTGKERVGLGESALRKDVEALADSSAASDGVRLAILSCEPPAGRVWTAPRSDVPRLSTRVFERLELDPGWRRHSYTSLTREAGHPALVEQGREGFDPDDVDTAPPPATPPDSVEEVPLARFLGGAEAGTLLHEVFERAHFSDVDAPSSDRLRGVVQESLRAHGFDVDRYSDLLVNGLQRVFLTPLGAVLGQQRLADVPKGARLDELRFDLPILGGTQHQGGQDRRGPANGLVAAMRSRDDGVLPVDWLANLVRLEGMELAGFLTGSIDLVFHANGQWFVVDYKSNRIDPNGTGMCVPEAFGRASMTAEMARHDYFLQYHLYLVALHRYLGWRLTDYQYDRHVGGVYYLFVRGMIGPDTLREKDAVRGCWFDRPPQSVIEAMSRALDSVNFRDNA